MCGIVGYTGCRMAYPILIKGLHRLEYRGYDSAGIALVSEHSHKLNIYKARGKVSKLEQVADGNPQDGQTGIAHTRWATHGLPTEANAHPHQSESGRITLVHNGIIENYATLREQLQKHGYHFKSETDTEVLVQLIEYIRDTTGDDLATCVRLALNKVIGAYAIVVVDSENPDTLVAARKSSPMVIGIGENDAEYFIASDATAIGEYTTRMVYLQDEQMAVCHPGEAMQVLTLDNDEVKVKVKHVKLDMSQMDHDGYPHFMIKEIHDQPACLRSCMQGRLVQDGHRLVLGAVTEHREELVHARRFVVVSCGTSWHAGLIGKQLIERYCRVPVEVAYASEFRYSNPVLDRKDVVIAISQSGETADTLAAIQLASQTGALVYGIVNGVGSSIARNSDTGTYIHVGPEIGVASTKAFTGQVAVLTMLALTIAQEKGTISDTEYQDVLTALGEIPSLMEQVLKQDDRIRQIASLFDNRQHALYLGRGLNYPVALEGALKLKEISYIHAEGYPAAEMKHGPIALVDENMPVVFIAPHTEQYDKSVSNMQEVVARKGHILAVVTEGDTVAASMADAVIEIPKTHEVLTPLLTILPLQMLSYHVAVAKGLNVDQPRNLAKSVTVE